MTFTHDAGFCPVRARPNTTHVRFCAETGVMCKETILGKRIHLGVEKQVWISLKDLRRHVYILGKTGSGKSTLLFNMLSQWIQEGRGCGLIDPHGDLAESLLDVIPKNRIDDICYIYPGDLDSPVSFNPLLNVPKDKQPLVAQGIVRSLQGIWRDSWGPRMENILRNALQAIMATNKGSFLGLQRMLTDDEYRKWVLKHVDDPILKHFWEEEFGGWDSRTQREAVSPIQNKVGQFLNDPGVRNILCQGKSKVDLARLMDERKILIVNLSKGAIGAESANLLGSLMVALIGESAMGRSERGNADKDFHLVIDEFHNFITHSFEPMLSEVRKYGLSIILSNQYGSQIDAGIRDAVIGNVGSFITFMIGGHDAKLFSEEYGHPWSVDRFTELAPFYAVVRKLDGGSISVPHFMKTLPPFKCFHGNKKAVILRSRQRYATPRAKVERKIRRWFIKQS